MTEFTPRILTDLNPNPPDERPHLSQNYRYLFIGMVLALTYSVVMTVSESIQIGNTRRAADALEQKASTAKDQAKALVDQAREATKSKDRALRIGKWISSTIGIEPIVATTLNNLDGKKVSCRKLVILPETGVQQFTLKLTLVGDEDSAITAIKAIEEALKQSGCVKETGDGSDYQFTTGETQYSMLWSFKAPSSMNWRTTS